MGETDGLVDGQGGTREWMIWYCFSNLDRTCCGPVRYGTLQAISPIGHGPCKIAQCMPFHDSGHPSSAKLAPRSQHSQFKLQSTNPYTIALPEILQYWHHRVYAKTLPHPCVKLPSPLLPSKMCDTGSILADAGMLRRPMKHRMAERSVFLPPAIICLLF